MADKGAVGVRNDSYLGPMPFKAGAFAAVTASGGIKNHDSAGPMPGIGGRVIIGIPPDLIPPIIASYGHGGYLYVG